MKNFKSHFWYSNSQRNGILFLVLIIIALQLIYFFGIPHYNPKDNFTKSSEIIAFQHKIDSLKQLALQNKKSKIYPFNPSFLTDYKGYQLGMSTEEIDRLLQHRAQGKYINSVKQFQEVTHVSDSLLHTLKPYFKFPDWVTKNQTTHNTIQTQKTIKLPLEIQDLNLATALELQRIQGIGEKLAERIIKYRNKLGGYQINEQLYEVWGLKPDIAQKVLMHFKVLETPLIKKVNINTATFKEVLSIVYIDYELTKKIFNYRDEVAEIQSLEELKKIDGFPLEKFDRIALYLVAK